MKIAAHTGIALIQRLGFHFNVNVVIAYEIISNLLLDFFYKERKHCDTIDILFASCICKCNVQRVIIIKRFARNKK